MTYTQAACVAVVLTVLLDLAVLRTRLLTRRAFWVAYAIVVGFQLVTNGVLTGLGVVRYDGASIIGGSTPVFLGSGRIAYAPVEDLLFGFALVVQTLVWWVLLGPARGAARAGSRGRRAGADLAPASAGGERELQHQLALVHLARLAEPLAQVEAQRRSRPLSDEVRSTFASALVHTCSIASRRAALPKPRPWKSLVDEQPPQVVRAQVVGVHHGDAVAEHDEAHGLPRLRRRRGTRGTHPVSRPPRRGTPRCR